MSVRTTDHGYSPDVELDHKGTVVAVRDIGKGEVISVPLHLVPRMLSSAPKPS